MTKFLRREDGSFNTYVKSTLMAAVIGLGGFVLTASAKVMFGAPVEAKLQDEANKGVDGRLKNLEAQMAIVNAKLDTIITYQLRDRYAKR